MSIFNITLIKNEYLDAFNIIWYRLIRKTNNNSIHITKNYLHRDIKLRIEVLSKNCVMRPPYRIQIAQLFKLHVVFAALFFMFFIDDLSVDVVYLL